MWEVTAEFHRLNVLLMRVEESDIRQSVAKKVATATLLDAKIEAQLGKLCFFFGIEDVYVN